MFRSLLTAGLLATVCAKNAGHTRAAPSLAARGTPANAAAGASIAITQDALDYVNDNLATPMLVNMMNSMKLPNIDGSVSGVEFHVHDIHTEQFSCDHCITLKVDHDDIVKVALSQFTLHVQSDFFYIFGIIRDSGHCDTSFATNTLSYDLKLGMQDGRPTLEAQDVKAMFDRFDLGCSGLSGNVANLIVNWMKQKLIDALNAGVKSALESLAQAAGNGLQKIPVAMPVGDTAMLRWDFVEAPQVKESALGVGVLGVVIPSSWDPSQELPYPHSSIPYYDAGVPAYMQVALTDYSVNSLFYSLLQGEFTHKLISGDEIPPDCPVQLTTKSVSLVAPGLQKAYPDVEKMQIIYEAHDKPWVNITEADGLRVTIPSIFNFQVLTDKGPVDAFALFCPASVAAKVTVEENAVAMNLTLLECHLTAHNSSVGDVKIEGIAVLTDIVLKRIVLPLLNFSLKSGFPLPASDILNMISPEIIFRAGYILVATKFEIHPPALQTLLLSAPIQHKGEKSMRPKSIISRRS